MSNKARKTLVTTAIESTWPKSGKVLFLGDWCHIYDRAYLLKNLEWDLTQYHWNDREKLYLDYKYLKSQYERYLKIVSKQLNIIHATNYSNDYWRILIGPWLESFIHILFDRWTMLDKSLQDHSIYECNILNNDLNNLIPSDMNNFNSKITGDDWNEAIYGELLLNFFSESIDLNIIKPDKINVQSLERKHSTLSYKIKSTLISLLDSLSKLSSRDDDIFLISLSIPKWSELKLHLCLGQIPKFWRIPKLNHSKLDMKMRDWKLNLDNSDEFDQILTYMIPRHIPKVYLEGYDIMKIQVSNLSWPKKPKAIFTSTISNDDIVKAWIAEKKEMKAPLVLRQYGGVFGISAFFPIEDHIYKIVDKYLSWGWVDKSNENVEPLGNLRWLDKKVSYNPKGLALLVEWTTPRYCYTARAAPLSSQWTAYFDNQIRFISALPNLLQQKLLIRLMPIDHQRCQKERWAKSFPDIAIDDCNESIFNLIKKSRVYISTYNATTFLESLAWNVPTIIFWDPKFNELSERAFYDFELLRSVGIFHETPESAALQLIKIWDDIDLWWKSEKVQSNRKVFCQSYSRVIDKPLQVVANKLIEVSE